MTWLKYDYCKLLCGSYRNRLELDCSSGFGFSVAVLTAVPFSLLLILPIRTGNGTIQEPKANQGAEIQSSGTVLCGPAVAGQCVAALACIGKRCNGSKLKDFFYQSLH